MKLYSARFNVYDGGQYISPQDARTVSKQVGNKKLTIKTSKNGELIIPEFELQKYESYGEGYDQVKFIGNMDDKYFISITETEVNDILSSMKEENKSSYEVLAVSASKGSRQIAIIEAKNEKEAWMIAKDKFPRPVGHLNVRAIL